MTTHNALPHEFTIKIGDWSGDGHGQCTPYRVRTNLPLEEVREAYFPGMSFLHEGFRW